MYEIRYSRDDIIPMLRDDGIATTIMSWLRRNASEEFLMELIQMEHSLILLRGQLRQLIADLKFVGTMEGVDIESLPQAIVRPVAPTGIGCANGSVWVTPPGATYILRFYVNGIHKLTMPDYYITSLESIGAVAGDVIQVAAVAPEDVMEGENVVTVKGTVGWWARIVVA
jgi:hypothetical protein